MAKKKLTPYEKAQRQFVQTRLAETGLEASPETRQRFRQRFDTLAAEKQGRTKLAGKLLPGAGAEERKNFKRTLATELPSRNMTTSNAKEPKPSYSEGITQGFQQAVKSGSYKVPTTAKKPAVVSPPATQTSVKGPNVFQNRRNNILGQGINYPGRATVERFTLGANKGPIDFNPKGVLKALGGEASDALSSLPALALGFGTIKGAQLTTRYGGKYVANPILRGLSKILPNLGSGKGINKVGGVGKNVYGPTRPASPKGPLALNPGPAQSVSPTVKAPTVRVPRLNTKGGVGGQPYGPQRPYGPYLPPAATTKAATTKAATTKAATTKAPTTKASTTKGPPKTKEQLDDEAYNVAQMKNRFPGSTEKDAPFVAKLNRAQEAIEKQSEGYQNYAKWLRNDQTQATIARLKRKK